VFGMGKNRFRVTRRAVEHFAKVVERGTYGAITHQYTYSPEPGDTRYVLRPYGVFRGPDSSRQTLAYLLGAVAALADRLEGRYRDEVNSQAYQYAFTRLHANPRYAELMRVGGQHVERLPSYDDAGDAGDN
jgi:hypothetical protein